MAFLILAWFVVTIIYIVVRATKSLKLGKATAYGVWVLIMEVGPLPAFMQLGSVIPKQLSCLFKNANRAVILKQHYAIACMDSKSLPIWVACSRLAQSACSCTPLATASFAGAGHFSGRGLLDSVSQKPCRSGRSFVLC